MECSYLKLALFYSVLAEHFEGSTKNEYLRSLHEYLRSLQLCEDQGIRRKLKRNVYANLCLRFLQLIPRPGFKKMHKKFATVKKRLTAKI